MNAKEAAEFEASDTFHTILDLRHWDDLGKEREVPATNEKTDYYKGLCKKLLVAQQQVAVKEIETQWKVINNFLDCSIKNHEKSNSFDPHFKLKVLFLSIVSWAE